MDRSDRNLIQWECQQLLNRVTNLWLARGPAGAGGPIEAKAPILIGGFVDTLVYVGDRWLIAERKGSIELEFG